MQLSITTDYAMRITLYLLKHKRVICSGELSKELNVPKTYVLKVTKKLESAGIVESYQGVSGGIRLVKWASELTLWDVIAATENTTTINKCLEGEENCNCNNTRNCPVRKVYLFLQQAVEERLMSIKLEDLMGDVENLLAAELEVDKKRV